MAHFETFLINRLPQLICEFPHYAIESLREAAEAQDWDEDRTIEELYMDADTIELEDFCKEGEIKSLVEGYERAGKDAILTRLQSRPISNTGPDHTIPEEDLLELEENAEDLPIYLLANYVLYSTKSPNTFVGLGKLRHDFENLTVEATIYSVSAAAEDEDEEGGEPEKDFDGDITLNSEGDFKLSNPSNSSPDSGLDSDRSDEDPSQDIDGKRLQLSSIIEYRVHLEPDGTPTLWIKTLRAWYKFGSPRGDYRPFSCGLLASIHRLGKLFRNAAKAGRGYTLEEYKRDEGDRYYSLEVLKRRLTSDLLNVFCDREGWEIALSESEFELEQSSLKAFVRSVLYLNSAKNSKGTGFRPPRLGGLKRKDAKKGSMGERFSVATPWIATICRGYILGTLLRVVGGGSPTSSNGKVDAGVITITDSGDEVEDGSPDPLNSTPKMITKTKRSEEAWENTYGLLPLITRPDIPLSPPQKINPGDFVLTLSSEASNPITSPTDLWIGKVIYRYKKNGSSGKELLHVRWFCQSEKTILAEFSDSKELFMLRECGDIPVESVLRKVDVLRCDLDIQDEVIVEGRARFYYRYLYDIEDASFHDAVPIDNYDLDYESLSPRNCGNCHFLRCQTKSSIPRFNPKTEAIEYRDVSYSTLDCVYIDPQKEGVPFLLGIILSVEFGSGRGGSSGYGSGDEDDEQDGEEEILVGVRMLGRVTDLIKRNWGTLGPNTCHKSLYLTAEFEDIPAHRLRGKFFLSHKEALDAKDAAGYPSKPGKHFYEFIEQENCFYIDSVMQPTRYPALEFLQPVSLRDMGHLVNLNAWDEEVARLRAPKNKGYKLKALDLFSGCGGLTHGIESVAHGTVVTKWAVEMSSDAAEAFKRNYPRDDLTVYNGDANKLLEKAILEHNSSDPSRVKMKSPTGVLLPPMPKPGEVDFIYGGPPCQGFSGMNRFQKADCLKNSLIATFLSYVDHYKPKYVLLENVQGLAAAKMWYTEDGKDPVSMGFVKFIVRGLTSMGYQVRIGLLQAGQFGVPQSRTRFIFWGARIGVELPRFPSPTHTFEKPVRSMTLVGVHMPEKLSMRTDGNNAPHRQVCVGDVMYDLPAFRYEDSRHWPNFPDVHRKGIVRLKEFEDDEPASPGEPVPNYIERFDTPQLLWFRKAQVPDQLDEDVVDELELRWGSKTGKRQELFSAVSSDSSKFVGLNSQPYRTTPLNEYQRSFRSFNAYDKICYEQKVEQHVTRPFPAADVQRIVNVPLKPGADHRDLPFEMRPWCLANEKSQAASHRFYPGLIGRLDENAAFKTALTKICITGNSGTVLHPRQQRVISVREHARSQGFKDSFIFVDASGGTREMHTQIGNAVPLPLGAALGRGLHSAILKNFMRERKEREKGRNDELAAVRELDGLGVEVEMMDLD